MIRTGLSIFILFCFQLILFSQDKMISLEDIYEKGTFSAKGIPGFNFMKDGLHYTKQSGTKILKNDLESGQEVAVLFDAADFADIFKGRLESYSFSADETKILLATGREAIYRYSSVANYYSYDVQTKTITRIFPNGKIKFPSYDPSGSKVAFVYENDLYYQDLMKNKIVRITKDGRVNNIINGASDWVYEEEFTLTQAYEWSPLGDQIAFIRFDESKVKEFTLDYFRGEAYPEKYTFKYPKVGEENSKLTVYNYSLKKNKLRELDLGPREDDYIPRIQWTLNNDELCVSWLNRDQNHLKLILVNTKTKSNRILLEERNKYYMDIHDHLQFLSGERFLWTSEQDGFNHLYLYDMNGKLLRQLTKGTDELTEVYGMDFEAKSILCQFATSEGIQRKISLIRLEDGTTRDIIQAPGTHNVQASPGLKYLFVSSSDISRPVEYRLTDLNGNTVRVLETNEALRKRMEEYALADVQLTKIANREGTMLNALLMKPKDFSPIKKYPVFMFLYGGPGSQQVMNRWNSTGNYWWFQMLAQKGYIICVVDNRGTGGRGEEFKKMTYMQLGHYETEDQIDAAKYLSSLPYVDGSRIGIFGWSYGGYMSSLCILKGNDVFKSAIAVAPVTNWKWYDSIYTERYMKRTSDNKSGYEENSPVNFADRLKGNYLLVHGMADDNVHFQNTAEMANALIKNKKQFDTYFYPNRNHGIGGDNARIHLYQKMTNFILEKL